MTVALHHGTRVLRMTSAEMQIKLLPRVMFDLAEVGVPDIVVCDC